MLLPFILAVNQRRKRPKECKTSETRSSPRQLFMRRIRFATLKALMARLWSPRLRGLWMHLHALRQIWGQNILRTGDWAENRQAGKLHKKDLGEHLQAGNVHYLQISWCSWQEKLISLSEPNSIVLTPGREEACRLLWVCHWPWVFWKHSKKLSLWILLTEFLFLKVENMFHVSFLVKQRVVCLTVRHTTWNIKSYRFFFFIWWWKFLQVDDEVGLPFLEPVSGAQCAIDYDRCRAIFSSLDSGGRGGGEEEVVKNQAVISISYQVLDEPSKLFLWWPINLFWTFAPF